VRRACASLLAAAAVIAAAALPAAVAPAAAALPAAVAAIPAHPRFESSARFGVWAAGPFFVNNDKWNPAAGPQTIWADSPRDWGAESTQPAGSTAVLTYPDVQRDFPNVPVSGLGTLRTGYAESMPAGPGLDAEAADDVWLDRGRLEVMIWVDDRGQRPAGTVVGRATIAGQRFSVWNGGRTWTFRLDRRQPAGQTHILSALRWLISRGDIPAGVTLAQVGFGWEIASTGGRPMDFAVTRYWLAA
jgi:hypothetical protein